MTDIKPCAVKGCTSTKQHHHERSSGALFQCPQGGGSRCSRPNGAPWVTPLVAPRLTRKALNARIAELEAENADMHAEIADKKDRLARCELPADVTWSALNVNADGKTIGFIMVGGRHFIGCNYDLANSAAVFKTTLDEAVQHVRQTYLAAVEAGEVAVA